MINWFVREEGSLRYYLNVYNLELQPIPPVYPAKRGGAFYQRLITTNFLYVELF